MAKKAIIVEVMDNWFGMPPHPTDKYIHWTDDHKKLAEKLRAAYDKIIAAGLKDELDILTEAAYDQAHAEAADDAAGEDI